MIVRVRPGVASWAHDGKVYEAGEDHDLLKARKSDREAATAAVAAGALELVDGDPVKGAVESDEDSLRRYEAAHEAMEPLYAERDADLAGKVVPADVARRAADPDDPLPALDSRDVDAIDKLAEAGSEYHASLLGWSERMRDAASEAAGRVK